VPDDAALALSDALLRCLDACELVLGAATFLMPSSKDD